MALNRHNSIEWLRTLWDKAGDALFVSDLEGHLIEVNERACRNLGYTREELLSMTIRDVEPGFDIEQEKKSVWDQIEPEGATDIKRWHRRKDGTLIPVEVRICRIELDGTPAIMGIARDITEREKAEEALRNSELRFRTIFEEAGDGILVLVPGEDGIPVIRDANNAACRMHGYTREELTGKSILDIDAFADPGKIHERVRNLRTQQMVSFETRHRRKDGTIFPVEVCARSIVSPDGELMIISRERDITEQKRKELHRDIREELSNFVHHHTKEEVLQYAIDRAEFETQSKIGFFHLMEEDEQTIHLSVWSRNTFTDMCKAQPMERHYPLEQAGLWGDCIRERRPLIFNDYATAPNRRGLPEGHAPLTRIITVPIFMGETLSGLMAVGNKETEYTEEDITILTTFGEEALRLFNQMQQQQEREQLLMVLEQIDESIIITDRDGTIQYVNRAFEKNTLYSKEEVIGKNPRILKSGKHNAAFYRNLWETITMGRTWSSRMTNKRKDGVLYTVDVIIHPVFDKRGEIVNYVSSRRDVTRQIEMEGLSYFAGGMAHHFNNILQIIMGYTALLKGELDNQPSLLKSLDEIEKVSKRAATLVRQLLAFSRREILLLSVLNVNTIISNLIEHKYPLESDRIKIIFTPELEIWKIKGDQGQIEQVIISILDNARKAMPDGGTIRIETSNVEIDNVFCATHYWAMPGSYVCITVTDTGRGMDQETISKIFNPFFTVKGLGYETGLGLAAAYGIVKQHKGMILCTSEEGKGTTIKIYFPRINKSSEKRKTDTLSKPEYQ